MAISPVPTLCIKDVEFRYSPQGPLIFQGVNASLEPGQFIGLIGPNGTGKSTFLRLLAGLRAPSSGSVCLNDKPLTTFAKADLAKQIAFVPQDVRMWLPFSCREVVAMGRFAHKKGLSLFESSAGDQIVDRCLEETQVSHLADRLVNEISGGEAQRVRIAQALAQETGILVLDEPTSHLDIKHQVSIMELAVRLRRKGMTVIAALHDMDMAALYCDRLLVLSEHRLKHNGPPEQVLSRETIKEVFGVDAEVARNKKGELRVSLCRGRE